MYTERPDYGNGYRIKYLKGIEEVINQRREECEKNRSEFMRNFSENQEEYRKKYLDMLGWPLNTEPKEIKSVTKRLISRSL